MTVALRSPQLVGALIAVDNAPVNASLKSDFNKYVQGLWDIEEAQVKKQQEADIILKRYEEVGCSSLVPCLLHANLLPCQALPIRQFLLTNLVRSSDGECLRLRIPIKTLASNLDKMGSFQFNNPDEARYNGRTLIVRGTKSHYVADDVLPLIGGFFPTFKLIDLDSGHWVISEKPEAFRQGIP